MTDSVPNQHFHVGMNTPGYSPMNEPYVTDDYESAKEEAKALLEAESLTDEWDGPDREQWEELAQEWDSAVAEVDKLTDGEEFAVLVGSSLSEWDLGLVVWISSCSEDCEIEEQQI